MKTLILALSLLISTQILAKETKDKDTYTMAVTADGYEPSSLKVKAGVPITLKITRKTQATCAREIVVPTQKINVKLPINQEVIVKLNPLTKGEIKFGRATDLMISGVIVAE